MLTIRLFEPTDKEIYLAYSKDFYANGAALHPIPENQMENTFSHLMNGTPYADGFMLLSDGEKAGYCLVSFLWSTEAGGLVALIDELYVSPAFRGLKLGNQFLEQIETYYQDKIVGLRLEVCASNTGAIRLYQKHGYDFLDYRQMVKKLTDRK